MLQSILSLDESLLISARGLIGPEYALWIQILGESIVIATGCMLVIIWLYGVRIKDNEYKITSLRIFTTIILVFVVYGVINLGVPQWRPSPDDVAGGIPPLIPHPIGNSFPSGHALFSAALLVGIWRYYRKCWILALFVLLTLITTVSRVIGGVHYPGDIMGGLFFGFLGATLLSPVVMSSFVQEKVYPIFIKIAGWIKL